MNGETKRVKNGVHETRHRKWIKSDDTNKGLTNELG